MLLTHPREAIAFAGYVAGFSAYYGIKNLWFRITHLRPEEDKIRVRNGFFTPPAPARTYCDASAKLTDQDTATSARAMAESYFARYRNRANVVLVDVAPIPSCDENFSAFSLELKGVTNNSLQPLPIGMFNDGRHYTALGSRVVSTLIARQVNGMALQYTRLNHRASPLFGDKSLQTLVLDR